MDFKDYQKAALRTAGDNPDIRNCELGLIGEAGEFADIIKKWYFHKHELDKQKALKELGDVLWYVAVYCHIVGIYKCLSSDTVKRLNDESIVKATHDLAVTATLISIGDVEMLETLLRVIDSIACYLGSSLEEVMQMNIDKLKERYPNGFESEKSINRVDK